MYGTPPPSNETWSAPATDPEALNICELLATNPKFNFIGGPYEYVFKVETVGPKIIFAKYALNHYGLL